MDATLLRQKLHKKIDELPEQILEEVYSFTNQLVEPTWREIVDRHLAEETDPKELAMWREESAFLDQHDDLKETHLGQHIAMMGGKVIDHDSDVTSLYRRVRSKHPNEVVLITLVREEPATVYNFRSPRLN